MKGRAFTNRIGATNAHWLGKALGLTPTQGGGIDLLGERVGVEIKSRLSTYNYKYAVHGHQYHDFAKLYPDRELFWAFVLYTLSKPPRSISRQHSIEQYVTAREVRIVPREWLCDIAESTCKTGTYRYVRHDALPTQGLPQHFYGATIWLPENSPLQVRDPFA